MNNKQFSYEEVKTRKLQELASRIQYGYTAKARAQGSGPRYLRITDIQNGTVDWDSVPFCEIDDKDLQKYKLCPGDIVFARTGATVGKSFLIQGDMPDAVFASYLIRVQLHEGVDPKYLAYFFQSSSYWNQIMEFQAGIGQPNVNGKKLAQIAIPLPSIERQIDIVQRIETQVSRLNEAVSNLDKVQKNIKRFNASVLEHAVMKTLVPTEAELAAKVGSKYESGGQLLERMLIDRRNKHAHKKTYKEPLAAPSDLPSLPAGRVWTTLGQLTSSIKDGPHYSPKYVNTGIPFISGGNVRPDGIDFSTAKYISPELHAELSLRCKPEFGDVLYTKGGTTGIARVNTETRDFNVWVHVAVLKLMDGVNPFYLQHALNSPHCYLESQKYTHGVGNQDLGLTRMVKITVPLPPVAEQLRIVAEVDRLLSVSSKLEAQTFANLKRAERLRNAIFAEAFGAIPGNKVHSSRSQKNDMKKLPTLPPVRKSETDDKRQALKSILSKYPNGISPEVLFIEAGYAGDQVPVFYRDLAILAKEIVAAIPTSESKDQVWPMSDLVTIKLV